MIKPLVKRGIAALLSPKAEFEKLNETTLEIVVEYYIKLLLVLAVAGGIFNFILIIIKALYINLSMTVNIDYPRMLNYAISISTTVILFYLVGGTVILFIMSLFLRMFIKKGKYTDFIKILLLSMTPILLFGWIPQLIGSLFIWSAFLFYTGIKTIITLKTSKKSIRQRD